MLSPSGLRGITLIPKEMRRKVTFYSNGNRELRIIPKFDILIEFRFLLSSTGLLPVPLGSCVDVLEDTSAFSFPRTCFWSRCLPSMCRLLIEKRFFSIMTNILYCCSVLHSPRAEIVPILPVLGARTWSNHPFHATLTKYHAISHMVAKLMCIIQPFGQDVEISMFLSM